MRWTATSRRRSVRWKVRELLSKYQFPGDRLPSVKGSALKALEGDTGELGEVAIMKLADALDSYIPTPERAVEGAGAAVEVPVPGRQAADREGFGAEGAG